MTRHRDLPLRTLRWARRHLRKLALATSAGGAALSLLGLGVLPVSAADFGQHRVFSAQHVVRNGGPVVIGKHRLDDQTIKCVRDHGGKVSRDGGRVRIMIHKDTAEACGLPAPDHDG